MNDKLRVALANTFAYYFKAHSFHWNVEGIHFPSLHRLFGEIYEDAWQAVDRLAEELRAVGEYAPVSLSSIQRGSLILGRTDVPNASDMLVALIADNETVITTLHAAYMEAEANMQHGLSNTLAERLDTHNKFGWMLKATAKQEGIV